MKCPKEENKDWRKEFNRKFNVNIFSSAFPKNICLTVQSTNALAIEFIEIQRHQACQEMIEFMEKEYCEITMDQDRYGFAIESAKEFLKQL